jgi:hypothetical protein
MDKTLERIWVSFQSSTRFRKFASQGTGRQIFQSSAYRKIHHFTNYWSSYYQCIQSPRRFDDVKTFCLFVGHNKCGSSMVGSLLDAHPNVILADEVGALQYVTAGFQRDQIYHLLLKGSRREFMRGRITGRRLKAYSFLVPGQWQGIYDRLQVIGDSTSGSSARQLGESADLLPRLRNRMAGAEIKFIQMIRNPYDPISISMVRGKRPFEDAVEQYFTKCEILVNLRQQLGPDELLPVRYEYLIHNPVVTLTRICAFLGIAPQPGYIEACTGILHPTPEQARHLVDWDAQRIRIVKDKMAQYAFLNGYTFESPESRAERI